MTDAAPVNIDEILIPGNKFLARILEEDPDFKVVGRKKEMRELQEILQQKGNNCVIMTGASGVGMTSLAIGLEAEKGNPESSPKFLGMPIHFLDVDKLFESGNSEQISKAFQQVRSRLSAKSGSVLFVENMGNFVDSCAKCGVTHLMNGLLGDIKKKKYQAFLETPYEDLGKVLKYNTDMKASHTLFDVHEPKGDDLKSIVVNSVKALEKHHGIRVAPEAIDMAINLASKHRTSALQSLPSGIVTLIDRALSSYALRSHTEPMPLVSLQSQLAEISKVLESGKLPPGQTVEEAESRKACLEQEIKDFTVAWEQRKTKLHETYKGMKSAQDRIGKLEDDLRKQLEKEHEQDGEQQQVGDSPQVISLHEKIAQATKILETKGKEFEEITAAVNKDLMLQESAVLTTFSQISGKSVDKLTESEREKVIGLEDKISEFVFGQPHAVKKVSNVVKNNAAGLKEEGKPKGSFLFFGPSGSGKTELVKVLNRILNDDPNALFRLDMSEFMEKHSVSRLIGAPPGYAGYEEGGALTNAMATKPIRILLVDEIEKAHPDVMNIFLQILDDARVTDGRGVTHSFEEVYIICTSNIGQKHMADKTLTYEEARLKAIEDLKAAGLRNELLNRFGGKSNIIGFMPLEIPDVERIVKRELGGINQKLKKLGLNVTIPVDEIHHIAEDLYSPENGARAVPGFFEGEVKPKASAIILETPGARGVIEMTYDETKKTAVLVKFHQEGAPANANELPPMQSAMNKAAVGQMATPA